ncbi:MAG TPA: DUF3817 domain-containing protein [Propionibacteriaceae bacterium]|nr:DUF3817 domain-containing protein [Propionibacteriaceae bacterium]
MTSPTESPAEALDIELDERLRQVRGALLRYRITAYIVGTLLVLLVCVAVPLKYFGPHDGQWVTYTGIPHGWLYMVLLITTVDLGRRVHWGLGRMAIIALSGLIPFLTFWAEHRARLEVEGLLREVQAGRASLD